MAYMQCKSFSEGFKQNRLFRDSSISHSTRMFLANQMIVKSVKVKSVQFIFLKATAAQMASVSIKSSHGKVYQQAVAVAEKGLYWGEMGSQPYRKGDLSCQLRFRTVPKIRRRAIK